MLKKLIITMFSLIILFSTNAFSEVSSSTSFDFVSKYVWRGFLLSDGPNSQPGVEIAINDLSIGYWGSFNFENEDYNLEQDFYIGYSFSINDKIGLGVGYTYYTFPSLGEDESHEFYFSASFDYILSPEITLYVDIGDEDKGGADGQYLSISIGHEFSFNDISSLSLGLTAGYNNELFINEKGFADLVPSISLSFKVSDTFSLGLSCSYSTIIDSDVEKSMGADDDFFAGLNISVG